MISIEELSRQVADLCPEDHLNSFLARDCRPDGRALSESRPVVLAKNVVSTCDFSTLVRLGKTKVLYRWAAAVFRAASLERILMELIDKKIALTLSYRSTLYVR